MRVTSTRFINYTKVSKMTLRDVFFFSSRRRHTRCSRDWSSDVCSSDLLEHALDLLQPAIEKLDRPPSLLETATPLRSELIGSTYVGNGIAQHVTPGSLMKIGRASCRERV